MRGEMRGLFFFCLTLLSFTWCGETSVRANTFVAATHEIRVEIFGAERAAS